MKPKRPSGIAPLLLCLLIPSAAMSASAVKEVEVNGVRLQYWDQGVGEPIVFVHGTGSDLRTWEPVIEEIAKKYRFIAYTQRYHGTGAWTDDGKAYSVATHAEDLAKFITSLDAGPVHVVGWSYGGAVVATAALKDPALVRSLVMYEPALVSVLPADSEEGKAARQEQSKMLGPSVAAAKAGDTVQAAKLLVEAVFQLPPGGFDSQPQAVQTRVLDNARTLPLRYTSPPPTVTCDALNKFTQPTLVMHGEKTQKSFMLISDAIRNCVPGAQQVVLPNVHHGGPRQDPAAFTTAVSKFVSKR
jgi:pimeloyl-ACP methyl ester carboxylesterase